MMRLEADKIGRRFNRNVLFWNLSFDLRGGQPLVITGSNGSGKSTLLRILAGVLRPTIGEVRLKVDGNSLEREERPLHTGFVAPYLGLYGKMSARENLQFILRARNGSKGDGRIDPVLDRVGLVSASNRPVEQFSSGMQQRLRIAVALIAEPPLLLLDEPWTNLDADGRAMVWQAAEDQLSSGKLLVAATNDDNLASRFERQLNVEEFAPT